MRENVLSCETFFAKLLASIGLRSHIGDEMRDLPSRGARANCRAPLIFCCLIRTNDALSFPLGERLSSQTAAPSFTRGSSPWITLPAGDKERGLVRIGPATSKVKGFQSRAYMRHMPARSHKTGAPGIDAYSMRSGSSVAIPRPRAGKRAQRPIHRATANIANLRAIASILLGRGNRNARHRILVRVAELSTELCDQLSKCCESHRIERSNTRAWVLREERVSAVLCNSLTVCSSLVDSKSD